MPELRLRESERARDKITAEQEKMISDLYSDAVEDMNSWAKFLEDKDNISSVLRRQYIKDMKKDLMKEMENIGKKTEPIILKNLSSVSTAVVDDANRLLRRMGIHIDYAYSYVPADVVYAIRTGQLYDSNWKLSKAIWRSTNKATDDINRIISTGVAENKSSYEIAKDLETYVNPKARKPWDWGKIYPGSSKQVDYNAQRLARTLVSHAYQQSFVRTTKDNPFFIGYQWLTSNHTGVCVVCEEYATMKHAEGLPPGVFPKDKLPLDHPNGRCTFSIYMIESLEEVADHLADWALGEENSEIDKYARTLGYEPNVFKEHISL